MIFNYTFNSADLWKKLTLLKLTLLLIFLLLLFNFNSFNLPVLAQNSEQTLSFFTNSNTNSQTKLSQNEIQENPQVSNSQNDQSVPNQVDNPGNNTENTVQNNTESDSQNNSQPSLQNTQTTNPYEFYQVKVTRILSESKPEMSMVGTNSLTQKLKAIIIDKNQEIELEYSVINASKEQSKIKVGDNLIVSGGFNGDKKIYNVVGFYRINNLVLIVLVFLVLTVLIAGFKGIMAFIGLLLSILAIAWWLVPSIIAGFNPFWACILVAIFLAFVNLYLAHGFRTRTSIALVSVLLTLAISAVLAPVSVAFVKLFGVASDEAFYLQAWEGGKLDLQGLFLGGIIIGTLGVLDDVATAQSATVEEIANANPDLGLWALYKSGMSVGREHILSMINTLALAYVGVSLPMILSFVIVKGQPWWAILSSDLITEEIIRTLVGSICLIIAVPICNFLAAVVFCKDSKISQFFKNKTNKFQIPNFAAFGGKFGDKNPTKNSKTQEIDKLNPETKKLEKLEKPKLLLFAKNDQSEGQNLKDKIMNLENRIDKE